MYEPKELATMVQETFGKIVDRCFITDWSKPLKAANENNTGYYVIGHDVFHIGRPIADGPVAKLDWGPSISDKDKLKYRPAIAAAMLAFKREIEGYK